MCPNYDLCEDCIDNNNHNKEHVFLRLTNLELTDLNKHKIPMLMNRTTAIHPNKVCYHCNNKELTGYLFICQTCQGVLICETCEALGKHDINHVKLKCSSSN